VQSLEQISGLVVIFVLLVTVLSGYGSGLRLSATSWWTTPRLISIAVAPLGFLKRFLDWLASSVGNPSQTLHAMTFDNSKTPGRLNNWILKASNGEALSKDEQIARVVWVQSLAGGLVVFCVLGVAKILI